ncbi:alpha/beta hydrolase [Sphingobium phenoxybenzoativorans]|uniref:Alpha/beta hydrolase n=1 Tax=Sphingobium phenoxybenzoativorans TaxID=1592790 RepID=A0A975KAH3_9SPHN|nr:alpha/beta hydrolase [Sphingobium phenoxybenzoativorans]QUT07806.1 alpha/beta hydrolase [Sphingobium phenoxybenzoativorans]
MTELTDPDVDSIFVGLPSVGAPRYRNGSHAGQGIYRKPAGKLPEVALIATHYCTDYSEHYLGHALARHGFGFLGWNTRFRGAEDQFLLETAMVDIGQGVKWLREVAGVKTVVLLGNSGGCSLMAAYQSIAQDKGALFEDAKPDIREALKDLPLGDLYIALNGHSGRPEVMTNWMDGSVIDEQDPIATDESLNPYNPKNGPPFSEEFITRYRAAQRARNQRITDFAKSELARLNAAGIPDGLFLLHRGMADLRFIDGTIDPSDRPVPRCATGDPEMSNRLSPPLGRVSSFKTWLSMWSLETSKVHSELHLPNITVPSFVIQGTHDVSCFLSDTKKIYDLLGSTDKSLEIRPGGHYFDDGPNYIEEVAQSIADWIKPRV